MELWVNKCAWLMQGEMCCMVKVVLINNMLIIVQSLQMDPNYHVNVVSVSQYTVRVTIMKTVPRKDEIDKNWLN